MLHFGTGEVQNSKCTHALPATSRQLLYFAVKLAWHVSDFPANITKQACPNRAILQELIVTTLFCLPCSSCNCNSLKFPKRVCLLMANSVQQKFVLLPLNVIRLQNLKFVFTVKAGDDKANASRKLPAENTPAEILSSKNYVVGISDK